TKSPWRPESMSQLIAALLVLLATVSALAAEPVAGAMSARPGATGWALERDVATPSYAVIEPASTALNIDSLVLSCEQGPHRRGPAARALSSGSGPARAGERPEPEGRCHG